MALEPIPVTAVDPAAGLSGNAPALLRELAERVRRLLATGETAAIDLNALPLTPADRDWLRARLGAGELGITLRADGVSTLDETGCPGIWWVTHRNERAAVVAEFIEIALVPALAQAHPGDVESGLEHLELLISDLG